MHASGRVAECMHPSGTSVVNTAPHDGKGLVLQAQQQPIRVDASRFVRHEVVLAAEAVASNRTRPGGNPGVNSDTNATRIGWHLWET